MEAQVTPVVEVARFRPRQRRACFSSKPGVDLDGRMELVAGLKEHLEASSWSHDYDYKETVWLRGSVRIRSTVRGCRWP